MVYSFGGLFVWVRAELWLIEGYSNHTKGSSEVFRLETQGDGGDFTQWTWEKIYDLPLRVAGANGFSHMV